MTKAYPLIVEAREARFGFAPSAKAILRDGAPRWHALVTFPQREAQAVRWLDARGVTRAFYPVEKRVRHRFGRRTETERRFVPGYVFAYFPGDPIWHNLLNSPERPNPFLRDVIRLHSGEPGWLLPTSIVKLEALASTAAELDREEEKARMVTIGCRARRVRPLMHDEPPVEVVWLSACGRRAKIKIEMFGSTHLAEIDVKGLVKMQE